MPNIYHQLMEAMDRNTFATSLVLQALYRREQVKEADKIPPVWRPYTVLVPGQVAGQTNPRPINVFPRNPKRSGFTMLNSGTGTNIGNVYFAGQEFDINEIGQQLAGQGQGVIGAGVLVNNSQISIVTSGPLYVAPTSATATVLTIIETQFLETAPQPRDDMGLHEGYCDANNRESTSDYHVLKDLV